MPTPAAGVLRALRQLRGLPLAAGAGASEPYPFIVSSGGQVEIILGPYGVIHIVAVSPATRPALA